MRVQFVTDMNQVSVHLVKGIVITTTESRAAGSQKAIGCNIDGYTFNGNTIQNEVRTVIEVSVHYPRSLYKRISLGIWGVRFTENVVFEPHA